MVNKKGYTRKELASFLLHNSLVEPDDTLIDFFSETLEEEIEVRKRIGNLDQHITCADCAVALTELHSQDRGIAEELVLALTFFSFSVTWEGEKYGKRIFFINSYQKFEYPMSISDFVAFQDEHGWDTDACRRALRDYFVVKQLQMEDQRRYGKSKFTLDSIGCSVPSGEVRS